MYTIDRLRILAGGLALFAAFGALPWSASAQQAAAGRIEGVVTDSVHRTPLSDATVVATPVQGEADSPFLAAKTDARGHFEIGGVRPGRYLLTVDHPLIDSTGIGPLPTEVTVTPGSAVAAKLALPSPATLRRVFCPAALADTTLGVMLGVVRRLDGEAVRGATVVFTWTDLQVDRATLAAKNVELTASAVTDSTGVYRACGLPVMRSIFVQAQPPTGAPSGVLEEQIGNAAILVRDFHLGAGAVARTDTAVGGRGRITGTVVGVDGRPVSTAQVKLFGTTRSASTDGAGAFVLGGIPEGTQGIEILALGYYPKRLQVDVSEATPALAVRLERAATVLDSIRVMAKRAGMAPYASRREFDDRRRTGFGQFFTADEIQRRQAFETADIFKFAHGVQVHGAANEAYLASARGRSTIGNTDCALDVYIDGMKVDPKDVNLVSPSDLYGAEIHTVADAPARFKVGPCGALFLWTR
jgi:hypothetical protein